MPFTKVADTQVHRGFRFTVNQVRYRADDGTEFDRDVVRHPGAVAVVPLHDDDTVTLVRQFRAALDGDLVFLATGLHPVADDRQGIEEQHMTVERLPLHDTLAMIADGRITDAKTIIGLTLTAGRRTG